MDEIDEMVVAVRADTVAFRRDIAALRGELEGSLGNGADAAGRAIERALNRAIVSGKLGFEDLKRLALSVMADIARAAMSNGIGAAMGGGGQGEGQGGGGLLALALSLFGAPGRATGGPVSAGRAYRVGERGPELFVPTASGRIEAAGGGARNIAITVNVQGHAPLPAIDLPPAPGVAVPAPDWPDAVGTVYLFDLPNIGSPAAASPHILVAGAGSNDGWRGADCWIVVAPGTEPISVGTVRPAAALGALAAPLAAGTEDLFDLANNVLVALVNPAMTLESVEETALLGGANRAMVGGELLQFGAADVVAPGVWRLSRLLRGRGGTAADTPHVTGTPFVLLDDPALMMLPDTIAGWAEGGAAVLQWAPRGGTVLTDVAVPGTGRALRPPAPVHGEVRGDGAGGVTIGWTRRSRVDTGWRDHVDLPVGESREAWIVALTPPVAGIGPWECPSPSLAIAAATFAALPPGCAIEIRQAGDFALSPALTLPLN